MGVLGAFDLAIAVFVFNYAETEEMLGNMLKAAAGNLKTGGRLVACVIHADYRMAIGDHSKYGATVLHERPLGEKCEYHTSFDGTAENAAVHFGWSQRGYEKAVKSAGFSRFFWQEPQVSAADIGAYPPRFWADFGKLCLFKLLVCEK